MSHMTTWLVIIVACAIAHAAGFTTEQNAGILMAVSGLVLALHWIGLKVVEFGQIRDLEPPYPEEYSEFQRWYFEACRTALPEDWMKAAQAAKRWENQVTKYRGDTA